MDTLCISFIFPSHPNSKPNSYYSYNLDIDLKPVVTTECMKDKTQKVASKKAVKKLFEERYTSGKNRWFFQKLRK